MKWEYLRVSIWANTSIMDNPSSHIKPLRVDVIGDDGKMIEWKKQSGDSDHSPVVSRLLKQLGDETWELTGVVPLGDAPSAILYFKRPLP
jgi:hypothetical protein